MPKPVKSRAGFVKDSSLDENKDVVSSKAKKTADAVRTFFSDQNKPDPILKKLVKDQVERDIEKEETKVAGFESRKIFPTPVDPAAPQKDIWFLKTTIGSPGLVFGKDQCKHSPGPVFGPNNRGPGEKFKEEDNDKAGFDELATHVLHQAEVNFLHARPCEEEGPYKDVTYPRLGKNYAGKYPNGIGVNAVFIPDRDYWDVHMFPGKNSK